MRADHPTRIAATMNAAERAEQNINLVHYVAKRYRRAAEARGEEYGDIFGAGCVGLMKASHNYNPELGFEYSTYASHMIRGAILNHFRQNVGAIRIPRLERALATQIFRMGLQDAPPAEIASTLGCGIDQVTRALQSNDANIALYLKAPDPHDAERTVGIELACDVDLSTAHVAEFGQHLSAEQSRVLRLRLAGETQREIADIVGLSQASISRILRHIGELFLDYCDDGMPVTVKRGTVVVPQGRGENR